MSQETSDTDDSLVTAWQSGNAGAGNTLTRRYYGRILRFFEYRAGPLAEELTQRTFAACAEALPSYRQDGSFVAFVFGIARRQLLRYQRERHRDQRVHEFDDDGSPGRRTSLTTLVSRHEEQRLLLMGLVSLPQPLQNVLVLHYWEGMKAREIAEVCECSTSTITSRLARAREVLSEAVSMLARSGRAKDSLLADPPAWLRSVVGELEQP